MTMQSPCTVPQPPPPELLRLADASAWAAGVVVLAAHPDDETIGAGAVLARLPVLAVVHATDGAPADRRWWGDPSLASREVYAGVRRAEVTCALAIAGIGAGRIRTLGYEDQRAALDMAQLTRDVAALLNDLRPGVVLSHAYEGGHPDHDAVAFALHLGRERMAAPPPAVVEFTSYHATGRGTVAGEFLPASGCHSVDVSLDEPDQARKERMLACFLTQQATLEQFPVGAAECFRLAPEYDFTRAPHPGMLHYERFDWGTTGAGWRAHAVAALEILEMTGAVPC